MQTAFEIHLIEWFPIMNLPNRPFFPSLTVPFGSEQNSAFDAAFRSQTGRMTRSLGGRDSATVLESSAHPLANRAVSTLSPHLKLAWSHDIAMDLGTANTLVYVRKRGIVFNEPTVVAIHQDTGKVVAVGHRAKEMFGRTGRSISVVRPLKNGTIHDFDVASAMIRHLLGIVQTGFSMRGPRLVVGVPSGISYAERRAVADASLRSGVSTVLLAGESVAAAIGAGLSLEETAARMIVDIGGGTTEVAVMSKGEVLHFEAAPYAGDACDEAIQKYVRDERYLAIGCFEAERLKIQIGSASAVTSERSCLVTGQDILTGLPGRREITDGELSLALREPLSGIVGAIFAVLEQASPEIIDDISRSGICLAGGGSLLTDLPRIISEATGIACYRANDPLHCVVRGVGRIVDDLRTYKRLVFAE